MPNKGMNAKTENTDEYETPPWLFKALDTEFGFTFDAAANEKNHLCDRWTGDIDKSIADFVPRTDDVVFCNPPYSNIDPFIYHALYSGRVWVLLLPANRGSTQWFQLLWGSGQAEFRWFRKRIRFLIDGKEPLHPETGKVSGPRFPSLVAIVRPRRL